MGVVVLVAEIAVIIAVVAVDPSDLRMPMEMALTKVQRAVLGGVTLIILLEALVFGVIDVCKLTSNYYTGAWYILCMYNRNNGKTSTILIPIIKSIK